MTNREIVEEFYAGFFNAHDLSVADRLVKEDYIQHNPSVAQGRKGLQEAFRNIRMTLVLDHIISEGDMVAVHIRNVDAEGNTRANVVDIYRIEDGMLAEHWDVVKYVEGVK